MQAEAKAEAEAVVALLDNASETTDPVLFCLQQALKRWQKNDNASSQAKRQKVLMQLSALLPTDAGDKQEFSTAVSQALNEKESYLSIAIDTPRTTFAPWRKNHGLFTTAETSCRSALDKVMAKSSSSSNTTAP